MSIKIYKLEEMPYTPFVRKDSLEYFNNQGIELTDNEKYADIYVSRFYPVNSKKELLLWRLKRRFIPILVWTHEPRYNTMIRNHFPSKIYIPDIHIMNCYTGDVLFSPWCFYGSWSITHKVEFATKKHFDTHKKNVCSLGSFRHEPLIINNKNIDLTEFRQNLSLYGYRNGLVDICGPNWPKDVVVTLDDRNKKDWHSSKLNFIKDYKFNIAIENTLIDNYITEKIWDPISQSVLPIYYGNDCIYKYFSKNSFIDTNNYSNYEELFDYISNITEREYLDRLNKCIETYNLIFESIDFKAEYFKLLDIIVNKIKAIVSK